MTNQPARPIYGVCALAIAFSVTSGQCDELVDPGAEQGNQPALVPCAFHLNGKGWTSQGGVISRSKSPSGNLRSVKEYRDFELIFDWRLDRQGNSGLIYRCIKGRGLEYQVVDDASRYAAKAKWQSGAIYDLVPPSENKPPVMIGEWNRGRIIAVGDHVEHWLNGVRVVRCKMAGEPWETQYKASKYAELNHSDFGRRQSPIVLQDHGHPVAFRNLRIRELDAARWVELNSSPPSRGVEAQAKDARQAAGSEDDRVASGSPAGAPH